MLPGTHCPNTAKGGLNKEPSCQVLYLTLFLQSSQQALTAAGILALYAGHIPSVHQHSKTKHFCRVFILMLLTKDCSVFPEQRGA